MVSPHVTFEEFVRRDGVRLRAGLVAAYGPEIGADAAAEALAYGFEHWDRLGAMANPTGYLYRVGQSAARQHFRPSGYLPVAPAAGLPEFEPGLAPALESLTEHQRSTAIGDDPLGLLADGWTRSSRDDEPFVAEYDGCANPSSVAIAGTESVREFLSDPVSGTTVVVSYLPASAGADLRVSTSALSGCAALVGSDPVTSLDEPGAGVSGFRTDMFALVAVSADGITNVESRPVAIALSVLPAADVAVVADLVERARRYVFSLDAIATDEPTAID